MFKRIFFVIFITFLSFWLLIEPDIFWMVAFIVIPIICIVFALAWIISLVSDCLHPAP